MALGSLGPTLRSIDLDKAVQHRPTDVAEIPNMCLFIMQSDIISRLCSDPEQSGPLLNREHRACHILGGY